MTTLVLGPRPAEIEAFLDRRRRLGQDLFDEVWEGVYHVVPGPGAAHAILDRQLAIALAPHAQAAGLTGTGLFNLGAPEDYRVPDAGFHRTVPRGTWVPTAAVVVEVVSPGDESYGKFDFYTAHGVDEVLIADPALRRVRLWRLADSAYAEVDRSELLGVAGTDLEAGIDWPPA